MYRMEATPYVTHAALHIRGVTDAHRVFEAVRIGILPLIKRRLVPCERAQLRSGNVFVWEESDDVDGLVRWTEGRRWSQSRMRGDCLYYEEKIETTHEEREAKAVRRAMRASVLPQLIPAPPKRKDRQSKIDGLTKQTYSISVQTPDAAAPRRWHLVAYFSARHVSELPVLDDYACLRNVKVPVGIFFTTSRPPGWSFESFTQTLDMPGPSPPPSSRGSSSPMLEPREPALPPRASQPSPKEDPNRVALPPISPFNTRTKLPPLSSLGYPALGGPAVPGSSSNVVSHCHRSVCSDDRWILDRFRVVL
ncbi:Gti1/Pac2 family-domain-containing protein [Mycena belliarum]|uniref:Gti1/Pac2 family-domain-containing protein n=1 Tax=Mycena belliarum TaxID=1033014 RepID=A0AAD6ULP4_9AGAR|nr:Gti1/Pac2 family-domain-containing protein [Mycena belliae]